MLLFGNTASFFLPDRLWLFQCLPIAQAKDRAGQHGTEKKANDGRDGPMTHKNRPEKAFENPESFRLSEGHKKSFQKHDG